MNTITLHVPGISCHHCIHTINTELVDLEGVKSVEAKIDSKLVTVSFVPPATEDKIRELLVEINYPAEV
jgi:copper chaperone CopZ